jgi:hypothetical protein
MLATLTIHLHLPTCVLSQSLKFATMGIILKAYENDRQEKQ